MKESKKKLFLKHLKDGKGIITYACEKTGISRQTYYNWIEKDQNFSNEVEIINDITVDLVESKLLSAINNEDVTAIIFYLKTKGKKRGYVEQVDTRLVENPFEKLMKELPDEEEDDV